LYDLLNSPKFRNFDQRLNTPHIMSPSRFASGAVGGWKELGRTTLGTAGDSISVGSLADKRYYQVLISGLDTGGAIGARMNLNGDTGNNYAYRYSENGAADGTGTSAAVGLYSSTGQASPFFYTGYLSNLAAKEKLNLGHIIHQLAAGAATAPLRSETVNKWANTADAVSTIACNNASAGSYNTGSEVVILGWDPADTHTTNFWTELASASWSSGTSFNTGVFTPKKYIWVQAYIKRVGASASSRLTVGNTTIDTGSNYADRYLINGSTGSTATSQSYITSHSGGAGIEFYNIFVINNASNEKLFICHVVEQSTAGAGTAPRRIEVVGKWANTSNQFDILQLGVGGTDTISAGQIKVWGSD